MRRTLIALVLLIPSSAWAQAEPGVAAQVNQSIQTTIGQLIITNANLSAQLNAANIEIKALQKQIPTKPALADPPPHPLTLPRKRK